MYIYKGKKIQITIDFKYRFFRIYKRVDDHNMTVKQYDFNLYENLRKKIQNDYANQKLEILKTKKCKCRLECYDIKNNKWNIK
jgi:hypothetical protein